MSDVDRGEPYKGSYRPFAPRRRRDSWLLIATILTLVLQAVVTVYPEICGPLIRGSQVSATSK